MLIKQLAHRSRWHNEVRQLARANDMLTGAARTYRASSG